MKAFIISFAILIFAVSLRAENSYLVGGTNSSFAVNQLGAATFTLPIEVEPGINGMQPDLAVVYNSMGGNGIMGLGFSLQGLSAITKVASTVYHDSMQRGKGDSDSFELDGKRLYRDKLKTGYIYYLENDNQTVVKCEKNQDVITEFVVESSNGRKFYYGTNSNCRATDSKNNTEWLLSRVEDNYGNQIIYNYDKRDNYPYLSSIAYGNVSSNHEETIIFSYSDRDDHRSRMLFGGVKQTVKKCLTSIISGNRKYSFNYGRVYANSLHAVGCYTYSRLESVKVSSGEESLPLIEFDWKQDAKINRYPDCTQTYGNLHYQDG